MEEDKKNKRGKREGEQEAVMNYSLSFMEELEREEEVQQQLMKENEKRFVEILKKDIEERRETNKNIEEKNEDLERKIRMLKANYGRVQAFYERCQTEGPPQ